MDRKKSGKEPSKVLILGISGMLGHKLYQTFSEGGFDTYGIMRQPLSRFKRFNLFNPKKNIDKTDVANIEKLKGIIRKIKPDVLINAVGVVKQVCSDPIAAISLNSLFPHQLAHICAENQSRLIHISTDCVFSGKKGGYSEEDVPDADDLYGRSKLLGEVAYGDHLTIRTSIIGRELFTNHGLIEWFLSQKGTVNGYTKAVFSGLSTASLSHVLMEIAKRPKIKGILNIGTEKIDKYSLLQIAKREFGRDDVEIIPYGNFRIDRSLDASKMRKLGIHPKDYPQMVAEMARDPLYAKGGSGE